MALKNSPLTKGRPVRHRCIAPIGLQGTRVPAANRSHKGIEMITSCGEGLTEREFQRQLVCSRARTTISQYQYALRQSF